MQPELSMTDDYRCMNNAAFEILISSMEKEGRSLQPKTVAALYKIYVERKARQEAIAETGCETGTLSKAIGRFEAYIGIYLKSKNKVRKEWILDEPMALLVDAIEQASLTGMSPSITEIVEVLLKAKASSNQS